MAETIFFDTSAMEVSRNMASARDKQALTSGLHRSAGGVMERRRGGEWAE